MLCAVRYELQQTGKLREEDISVVPDVYLRNQQLDDTIKAACQNARRTGTGTCLLARFRLI